MKTINEMRRLVDDGIAKPLTIETAKRLKGVKIQTIYFGYAHQDGTDEFIVGDIMSELEYYRQLKEDCYPDNGFKNRAEYWESYMSDEKLQEKRDKIVLLKEDGTNTYMFCGKNYYYDDIFQCSDEDRIVYYIESNIE